MGKKLKIAVCLYKYFPFGGLQVNFKNIVTELLNRGHKVDVYTISWEGDSIKGADISLLQVKGLTNHNRYESFAKEFNKIRAQKEYDAVLGFNKMPGLDFYYCADVSYAAKMKKRSPIFRFTGRYKKLMKLEREVFKQEANTKILLLTEKEKAFYLEYYNTGPERFFLLPPGISKKCLPPDDPDAVNKKKRKELNISRDKIIILMVCTNFKIKGVKRSIKALSSLPEDLRDACVLLVVGKDNPAPFKTLAKKNKVDDRVIFTGARTDVPELLCASDLLLHPASIENTGTVIVEAIAAGLPVITTDICGYSFHVEAADAGKVVASPFRQEALNEKLISLLGVRKENYFQKNALAYIKKTDVFSRAKKAVDIIEKVCS